jgi:hypothetical protein
MAMILMSNMQRQLNAMALKGNLTRMLRVCEKWAFGGCQSVLGLRGFVHYRLDTINSSLPSFPSIPSSVAN